MMNASGLYQPCCAQQALQVFQEHTTVHYRQCHTFEVVLGNKRGAVLRNWRDSENPKALKLRKGQNITILNREEDDRYRARNEYGDLGVFPLQCVYVW